MKFRGKILILLLTLTLVPLLTSLFLQRHAMRQLGNDLANGGREYLLANTRKVLLNLAGEFDETLQRDRALAGLALAHQADRLSRRDGDDEEATRTYKRISDLIPHFHARHYTRYDSGKLETYPATGTPPDPAEAPWPLLSTEVERVMWKILPATDQHPAAILLAKRFTAPQENSRGVTAIEIPLASLFDEMRVPDLWVQETETLVVTRPTDHPDRIEVLLHSSQAASNAGISTIARGKSIEPDNDADRQAFKEALTAEKPAVLEMDWQGEKTFWAMAPREPHRPFPLIILPVDIATAQARKVEASVQEQFDQMLRHSGILLAGILLFVPLVSLLAARSINRPLEALVLGARGLANGNFAIRVKILSRDEFQELGNAFNAVGPQLQERQRMQTGLLLAREIQQQLLPAPDLPFAGLDLYGRNLSCDETGGDYFDFIPLEKGKLAVVVGDVTGHGIAAALLMATARGILRGLMECGRFVPGEILAHLNRQLCRDTEDDRFMTLFFGIVDVANQTLNWASAGQGPVFRYASRTGQVEEIPSTGMPLGILEMADYSSEGPLALSKGDVLVIGTDGLWEATNPSGEMFGIERVQDAIRSHASQPARAIHAALLNACEQFCGHGSQQDDLTLTVVKVVSAEA